MSLYSESIHKKIDEKLKEAKELFKSSEPITIEEKEAKFNELVELFKEKYGTNYLSYMTSFFLEPAIFVKVTDSFREAHMNDEEDSNDDEENSNDDEENSNDEKEDSNDEKEDSNKDEEDCDDACDILNKRDNESSDSEIDLDSEEKFKAMFEKLSAEMGDDEKKFLENLLKGNSEVEEEKGEEEDANEAGEDEEEGEEDEDEGEEEGE